MKEYHIIFNQYLYFIEQPVAELGVYDLVLTSWKDNLREEQMDRKGKACAPQLSFS